MSGFNALAVRLARSRRKRERERVLAGAARTGAGAGEPREAAGLAAVIAAATLTPGTTNVIQFPRR